MKKALLLFLLLFFLPTGALAGDFDTCEDTPTCICEPTDPVSSENLTLETTDDCKTFCGGIVYTLGDDSVTGYSVQCTVGGTATVLAQGDIASETEQYIDLFGGSTPELGVDIPGLEFTPAYKDGEAVVSNFLGEYIEAVYKWIVPAASLLAVVVLMIAGLQYMLARGNPERIGKAKQRITNSVTGVVLLLAVATMASLVDPDLLTYDSLTIRALKAEFVSTEDTDLDIEALNLSDPPQTESDVAARGTNGVTYYTQRGNNTDYSCNTTVESSGCGPTSAAMVYHTLGVTEATPSYVAQYFLAEGYRACDSSCNCNGTSYSAFAGVSIATENGIKGEQFSIDDTDGIYNALKDNQIFIVSVGPSIFTSGGHFIVLTGVSESGNILINDPNSGITEASVNDVFPPLKFAIRMYKE